MLTDAEIAKGCLEKKRSCQKELYDKYIKKMYALCRRYISDKDEIKDTLQEGFIKVFENIGSYRGEGSLEGWVRKIIVNTALTTLRKSKSSIFVRIEETEEETNTTLTEENQEDALFNTDFNKEDLLSAIEDLPTNYKIIFNLFCLENYSHREISEMLSITEESSRTRLNRARKILQEKLLTLHKALIAKQHN